MAQQTINTVIVLRNDSTTAWASSSYKLQSGEVGVGYMTRDLGDGNTKQVPIIKVGDGVSTWAELPQAEGVFEENLVLTHNFGRHKTQNGSVDAGGVGMTTSEWLRDALSEILNPKTNYPTANLLANGYTTDTGTNEIGSKIKAIKWKTETGNGSYVGNDGTGTYGTSNSATSNASGISSSNFTWSVSNETDEQTSTASSGTFTFASDDYIQIDSTSAKTYAYINGSVTLDASKAYTPNNNVGKPYAAGKITGFDKAGTTTQDFTDIAINATGFRNTWYYVGTDCTTAIDSDFIRSATSRGSNTTNFEVHTKTPGGAAFKGVVIPANTTRVMFAVPGTYNNIAVINVDGMGLPEDGFVRTEVQVEGANGYDATTYSVFTKENANGMAATGFTVSITK